MEVSVTTIIILSKRWNYQLQIITKCTATSELANKFYPLGLHAPFDVKETENKLPENLCAIWDTFQTDLESLSNFKIPRHVFNCEMRLKRLIVP